MHLIPDSLVINENSISYKIPLFGFYAVVIPANRGQGIFLGFIGKKVDNFVSILKITGTPFIERSETGTGKICLVTENAVELKRMAYRFVYS